VYGVRVEERVGEYTVDGMDYTVLIDQGDWTGVLIG
jgi:hypothetical protein